jgi:DNA-binding SARP family transcriptional activator
MSNEHADTALAASNEHADTALAASNEHADTALAASNDHVDTVVRPADTVVGPADTGPPTTMLNDEWRRVVTALQTKQLEKQRLERYIERYAQTIKSEHIVLADAKEQGDDLEIEQAQAAMDHSSERMNQFTGKRQLIELFEPLALLASKLRAESVLSPFNDLQKLTLKLSQPMKDIHEQLLQQVIAFSDATLLSNKVNEDDLHALQTSVAKQVGTYAASLEAYTAVWKSMQRDLDPGPAAKKTRTDVSSEGAKKPRAGSDCGPEKKKHKTDEGPPEESYTGGDGDDVQEDDSEGTGEDDTQKDPARQTLCKKLFASYFTEDTANLKGYIAMTKITETDGKETFHFEVFKDYKEKLNARFFHKNPRAWATKMNDCFERLSMKVGWFAPGCAFKLKPTTAGTQAGAVEPSPKD